jgi:predicted short-subunit dehydrogenase-like oxidoreductase (DUF2520 family)
MTLRTCSIIGTGVASRAITPALSDAGMVVATVTGRDDEAAARLAGQSGARSASLAEIPRSIDLLLLCVSDVAIAEVVAQLSRKNDFDGTIVAHLAGAHPASLIEPLRDRGARPGKAHPIASLAGGPPRLRGVAWGIEGDSAVVESLAQMVTALDGRPIPLTGVDLELYHVAAVFASNFLVGVLGVAADLWRRSSAPVPVDVALLPLAQTVLANWTDMGLERALTGPIARGDLDAVRDQLKRMSGDREAHLYRTLAIATAQVAARRTDVDHEIIAEIVRVLAEDAVLH